MSAAGQARRGAQPLGCRNGVNGAVARWQRDARRATDVTATRPREDGITHARAPLISKLRGGGAGARTGQERRRVRRRRDRDRAPVDDSLRSHDAGRGVRVALAPRARLFEPEDPNHEDRQPDSHLTPLRRVCAAAAGAAGSGRGWQRATRRCAAGKHKGASASWRERRIRAALIAPGACASVSCPCLCALVASDARYAPRRPMPPARHDARQAS